jgi:hypothetical protein
MSAKKPPAAPVDLIRALLKVGSLKATHRSLLQAGVYASEATIERERRWLISQGLRASIQRPDVTINARPADPEYDAKEGSEKLLQAQLRTGQHFITDRARFREACASVGLAA